MTIRYINFLKKLFFVKIKNESSQNIPSKYIKTVIKTDSDLNSLLGDITIISESESEHSLYVYFLADIRDSKSIYLLFEGDADLLF